MITAYKLTRTSFLITLILLLLVACATPQTAVRSAPPAALPGQSAADAQATLSAWNIQQQATAETNRQATAVSQQATAVAIQSTEQAQTIATGTAQAELSARVATSDALSFQATAQYLSFEATRQSYALLATATAESQQAAVVEALRADEAARLAQQREAERVRLERQRIFNAWLPVVVMAFLLILTLGIGAAIYWQLTKNRPVTITHDNRQITILPAKDGGFQMLPLRQSAPQLSAPQDGEIVEDDEPERLLDALETEQRILIYGESGAGKTNLLLWLMSQRQNALIVDPHAAPNDWPNCHVIGAGMDYQAIESTLTAVNTLMIARYQEIAQGTVRRGDHEKLTVFIDEYMSIVGNTTGAKTVIANLLTQARKSNIDMVLVSHSRNVEALGLKGVGDLRDGFAFVHLTKTRGQRAGRVVYGMDESTAVPVVLPGVFSTAVQPRYPVNRAAQIIGNIPQLAQNNTAIASFDGIQTEFGQISRTEIGDILTLAAYNKRTHGRELRKSIGRDLWEYDGGNNYNKIKYLLDMLSKTDYTEHDVQNLTQWFIDIHNQADSDIFTRQGVTVTA